MSTNPPGASPSPQGAPAPAPAGAAPAPGGHPGSPGGAPPGQAAGRQDAPQAAAGTDALGAYREVFAENSGLEAGLRESLGIRGGDHELAQALADTEAFFQKHATDSDRKFLAASGLGNDPAIVSFLFRQSQTFGTMERDLQALEVENARLRSLLDAPNTLRTVRQATPRGESAAMTNHSLDDAIAELWASEGEALANPSHRRHDIASRKLARLQQARYGG